MTLRNVELEFPDYGMILVTGSNKTAGGKLDSVGSGKTALGEALSRTLVGIEGRYAQLGNFSAHGEGDTYVRVDTQAGASLLRVELGHKCDELSKTGEGLRFSLGGTVVERGHIRNTRDELIRTVGVTPELSKWTVYVDGDKLKFNQLSQKDSVELVMAALNQPPWTEYHENSRKVLTGLKGDLDHATSGHEKSQTDLEDAKNALEEAHDALKLATQAYAQEKETSSHKAKKLEVERNIIFESICDSKKRQTQLKSDIKRIEDAKSEEYAALDIKRRTLQTELVTLTRTRDEAFENKTRLQEALRAEERTLADLQSEPDQCPKCGKPWDKKHGKSEISEARGMVEKAQVKLDASKAAYSKAAETASAKRDEVGGLDDRLRALNAGAAIKEHSLEYERLEDKIDRMEKEDRRLEQETHDILAGPDPSRMRQKEAVVEERARGVQKLSAAVEDAAHSIVEARTAVTVGEYWNEAFSPSGIPNMVLKDCIEPMNSVSRRISNLMTGGTIEIQYATSRELASGKERAQLVINVNNKFGSKKLEGNSKGESGLTNLIIAETLSEVGNVSARVGYRWYDEVINSQDAVVRRNILSYMHDLAHRLKILVFVVDHHHEIESFADHVLLAEKTTEGTSVRWV